MNETFQYWSVPGCCQEGERHQEEPGHRDQHQAEGGQRLDAGAAGSHLAQEISHIEHWHEHETGPRPETTRGQERLYPGVEAKGDHVGEGHGQHVGPDGAADQQSSKNTI